VQHAIGEHEALLRYEQRLSCCTALTGLVCQCQARGVHLRVSVDKFLTIVRHVVNEAADQRVGDQARSEDIASDHLRHGGLLHQVLVAAAGPFATDVLRHEDLGRNGVQALADVLSSASSNVIFSILASLNLISLS
jgi:hypothetical protein